MKWVLDTYDLTKYVDFYIDIMLEVSCRFISLETAQWLLDNFRSARKSIRKQYCSIIEEACREEYLDTIEFILNNLYKMEENNITGAFRQVIENKSLLDARPEWIESLKERFEKYIDQSVTPKTIIDEDTYTTSEDELICYSEEEVEEEVEEEYSSEKRELPEVTCTIGDDGSTVILRFEDEADAALWGF